MSFTLDLIEEGKGRDDGDCRGRVLILLRGRLTAYEAVEQHVRSLEFITTRGGGGRGEGEVTLRRSKKNRGVWYSGVWMGQNLAAGRKSAREFAAKRWRGKADGKCH